MRPLTAQVPISCDACGSSMAVTVTRVEGTEGPWLRADSPDIALAVLFARAHRGPLRLAGQPAGSAS